MNNARIQNLKDLFIEQGRELYDANRQEQQQLPNIKRSVRNLELSRIIDHQIKAVKDHEERLEEAFQKIGVEPQGEKSECTKAALRHAQNLMERSRDPEVRDAAVINVLQRLNYNNITGFGSLASYAREIGQPEVAESLTDAIRQERKIDRDLSELAEREINKKAVEVSLA